MLPRKAVFEAGDVVFATEGRVPFCGGNALRVWAAAGETSAEQASRRPSAVRRLWRVPPVVVVIFIRPARAIANAYPNVKPCG